MTDYIDRNLISILHFWIPDPNPVPSLAWDRIDLGTRIRLECDGTISRCVCMASETFGLGQAHCNLNAVRIGSDRLSPSLSVRLSWVGQEATLSRSWAPKILQGTRAKVSQLQPTLAYQEGRSNIISNINGKRDENSVSG